jgi:hypothetical protein
MRFDQATRVQTRPRVSTHPRTGAQPRTTHPLLDLQRAVGNTAVRSLLLRRAQVRGSATLARAPQNPGPAGAAVAGDQLRTLVDRVVDMAGPIAVRFLYGAGVREVKDLTNILFWALHPDMAGKKIRKGQTALARDWIRIRDSLVVPGIRLASAPGLAEKPPVAPGPVPVPYPTTTAEGSSPKDETPPPSTTPTEKPVPPGAPSTPAPLRDSDLAQLIASLGSPAADEIAGDLASLQAKAEKLRQTKSTVDREAEEIGAGRDDVVNGIEQLRQKIARLDGSLDPRALSDLKRRINLAVNDISPYYYQSKNIDVLESKEMAQKLGTETTVSTRTCNITSLSMALEGLGKSPDDYQGSKEAVEAAAEVFHTEVTAAKHAVPGGGGGETWNSITGLRLPDFVQLAAIAEKLGGKAGSPQEVNAAAKAAWDAILSISFLDTIAQRFSGVKAEPKPFELDPTKVKTKKERTAEAYRLKGWAKKHRSAVEKLVDLRNKMEKAPEGKQREKLKQAYEAALKKLGGVPGADIEAEISLQGYKTAVKQQIGGELETGSQIVVSLAGHYVRLQAIHEDHVVVDDPATAERASRKVMWDEARAMGYFNYRLVITG